MENEQVIILKDIRATLNNLLEVVKERPSKIEKIFNTVVAFIGGLGIIGIIDTVLNWLKLK
ncbi:MAG: hypothetical protein FWD28_11140 [Treponema sp.]|nr:hypothetical protein [Treponema sp.]